MKFIPISDKDMTQSPVLDITGALFYRLRNNGHGEETY